MKSAIALLIVLAAVLQGHAQTRNCATMEVLEKKLQEDPTLKRRMDSLETALQAHMKAYGPVEEYSSQDFPKIPGFVPTGDPKVDRANFARAKQDLCARDPELYRQLTRNITPYNQEKGQQ